jgi:hypothetical protein
MCHPSNGVNFGDKVIGNIYPFLNIEYTNFIFNKINIWNKEDLWS